MKYSLVIILCLNIIAVHGQEIVIETPCMAKCRIFKNYFNRTRIIAEGLNCSDIRVEGETYDIRTDKNCVFYIKSNNASNMPTPLKIYNKQNGKLIKEEYLEFTDSIPFPVVKFNNPRRSWQGQTISEDTDSIYCISPFSDRYNKGFIFSVLSFKVDVENKGQVSYSEDVSGNLFSDEIKKRIPLMYHGDKLILRSIAVRDQYGNSYLIPSTVLHLYYN